MQVLLDTQLMTQYLPGAPAAAVYQRVWMVPSDNGQPILFTLDRSGHLTVWLPGSVGHTRWVRVSPVLSGVDNPRTVDLDLVSNHGQGRCDNTLDLVLLADLGTRQHPDVKAFYLPGIQASTDPQAWRMHFAACAPLASFIEQPVMARLGLLPLPVRSVFLVSHQAALSAAAGRWRFDAQGRCTEAAPLPLSSVEAGARQLGVAAFVASRPLGADEDALIVAASVFDSGAPGQVSVQLPALAGAPPWRLELASPLGGSACWTGEVNVNAFARNDTGEPLAVFNLPRAGQLSQTNFAMTPALMRQNDGLWSLASSLPGWVVAPGEGHALRLDPASPGAAWRWLALVRPEGDASALPCLQMTQSADCLDANAASTLVAADVLACSACQCTEPDSGLTVLHLLVAYAEGGLCFFSQDSISGQWQRHTVTDDNLHSGLHQSTSYTTRIRVLDDSCAPVLGAVLRLRPQAPCYGLLNGQSAHLSPLAPTVVSTASGGEVTFIQPTGSLGAVQIDVEVVSLAQGARLPPGLVRAGAQHELLQREAAALSVALNPMDPMVARLSAVTSGRVLQQAQASDGTQPFAHRTLATCNQACAAMAPFLQAYHATLLPRVGGNATPTVLRCLQMRWQGGVFTTQEAPPNPRQDGATGAIGDILAYLWTAAADALDDVTVSLNWLSDGLCTLAVTIGEVDWSGLVAVASQAAELIHWALRKTLGASLDELVNWLGHVFNWDEIVRAHQSLRKLMLLVNNQASDWMRQRAAHELQNNLRWARALLSQLPDLDPDTRALLARQASSGDASTVSHTGGWSGPDARWGAQTFQSYSGSLSFNGGSAWPKADAMEHTLLQAGASLAGCIEDLGAAIQRPGFSELPLLSAFEDLAALGGTAVLDQVQPWVEQLLGLLAHAVDDTWSALNQRLQIPVLTPLYETVIAPGSELSLLDAVLLSAACLGQVGCRLALNAPLMSDAFQGAIGQANSLEDLLRPPAAESEADSEARATEVLLVVTLVGGTCKLLYGMAWLALRSAGAGQSFDASLVRSKCLLDTLAWTSSLGWAVARCASVQPPQESLRGTVVFLLADGLVSRSKDAVEIAYAWNNTAPPLALRQAIAGVETCFGAVLLLPCAVYTSVKVDTIPRTGRTDPGNWTLLQATPQLQSFLTSIYLAMALPDSLCSPASPLGMARTVANGVRCSVPLVSMVALAVAVRNDWNVPGTIAD